MLDKGYVKGAIVAATEKVDAWKPKPVVATRLEDLLNAQKTKYTPCPPNRSSRC